MGARGPKSSSAVLATVSSISDARPSPPDRLTERQKELWRRVTASENSGFFNTAALQLLLGEFCKAAEAAEIMAGLIDSFDQELLASDEGLDRYSKLLRMRNVETKTLAQLAVKLRLSNQSRYTPHAAATAAKNAASARPWERHN